MFTAVLTYLVLLILISLAIWGVGYVLFYISRCIIERVPIRYWLLKIVIK